MKKIIESIYQAWCRFFEMGYSKPAQYYSPKWASIIAEGERIQANIDNLQTELSPDDENPMSEWDDIGWPVAGGQVPNCS